jgi:hypothetical protein
MLLFQDNIPLVFGAGHGEGIAESGEPRMKELQLFGVHDGRGTGTITL